MKPVRTATGILSILLLPWLTPSVSAQLHRSSGEALHLAPLSAPVVSSFEPTRALAGSVVSIKGTFGLIVTDVSFGYVHAATYRRVSSSLITAEVPPGAVTAKVSVTHLDGLGTSATGTSTTNFTVSGLPTITSISPTSGPVGTVVRINGTNLRSNVFAIRFNGVNVPTGSGDNEAFQVVVPAGATTGAVSLIAYDGTVVTGPTFTVSATAPAITGFSPYTITASSPVTINGLNFTPSPLPVVKFNGVLATSVTSATTTQIQAVAPAGLTVGLISVTMGTTTISYPFPYEVTGLSPTVSTFSPATGLPGTAVTITGTNLSSVDRVMFGDLRATFTASSTQITAYVPRNALTNNTITVRSPSGSASFASSFTVSPYTGGGGGASPMFNYASGPIGMRVSIYGSGFNSSTVVNFAGNGTGISPTLVSGSQIDVTVPASAQTGPVCLSNVNTVSTGSTFTVLAAPPTIASFTPTSAASGTTVTLTGTNYSSIAASNVVFFGGAKATVTAATSTSLTCTVPYGATYGPVTVVVGGQLGRSRQPFMPTFAGTGSALVASSFSAQPPNATNTWPVAVLLADLNQDGKPEIVAACQPTSGNVGGVSILRNTTATPGTLAVATKVDLTFQVKPGALAVGDVDGDGKLDLVVAGIDNLLTSSKVAVLRNTTTAGSSTLSFATAAIYVVNTTGTSLQASGVAVVDFDLDGRADVLVANYHTNTIACLPNMGGGILGPVLNWTVGNQPHGMALVDLDNDYRPELLVANSSNGSLSLLPNTSSPGSPSVGTAVSLTGGTAAYDVAAADFDNDGLHDYAVACLGANTLRLTRNGWTSGALAMANFGTSFTSTITRPTGLTLADLDGNGRVDLAVVQSGQQTLQAFRNVGTTFASGMLASPVSYGGFTQPAAVAAGDVDNDGYPDLVVANSPTATVQVLSNRTTYWPTIVNFLPTYGAINSTVTLNGTNLSGAATATIGSGSGTVVSSTATAVTLQVHSSATTGYIKVNFSSGATATTALPFVVLGHRPVAGGFPADEPLTLYPNPAHDQVRISTVALPPGTVIQVLDPTGLVVRTVPVAATGSEQVVPLAGLWPGLYTLRAGSQTRRLMVE